MALRRPNSEKSMKKIKIKWLEKEISNLLNWLPINDIRNLPSPPPIAHDNLSANQNSINRLNACQGYISTIHHNLEREEKQIQNDFERQIKDAADLRTIRLKTLKRRKQHFRELKRRAQSYPFTFLQKQKKGGDVEIKIQFD